MAETEVKSINGRTIADVTARKNKADKSGWTPNKFIGTDENGNLVPKEAPSGSGGSTGTSFETGNALELKDGVLNVKTTDEAEKDNTLPITSSGVHTIVGNIGAILDTI